MTAEAEVCNEAVSEMATIDEKSEFKARSKPELNGIGNHDQADDPEDSYVLVNDVGDPSADGKDMAALDGSPQREPGVPLKLLGIELDARNGNPEGKDAGKHGNAEGGAGSLSLVNGGPDVQLISIVDGGGDQNTIEGDNKCLEELSDQNGKADGPNGEVARILMGGGIGNTESNGEIPLVANGVLPGVEGSVRDEDEIGDKLAIRKPEWSADSEIKKAEGSNGKVERSEEVEVAKFGDQNGKIEVVAEAELDTVEDQLISEASPGVEENQESKVPNLRLVGESEEEEEPKSSLSLFDKQETVEDVTESALGKEAMQDQKCDIDPENDVSHGLDKGNVVESNADCNVKMASNEVLEENDEGIFSVSHVKGSTYPEEEPLSSLSVEEEKLKSLLPTIDKQETIEDVAESALGNEATKDQKCDIDPENEVQHGLDKDKVVESNVDFNVRMASDQLFKGKDEGSFSVSHVEGSVYPEEEPKSSLSEEEEEPKSSFSPFHKQETVKDVAVSVLGNEAMQDQKCASAQHGLDKDKVVESNPDCNPRIAGEDLEGKDEGIFSVSLSEEEEEPKSSLSPFDKQETVEDVSESAVGKEAMQDQKCAVDPEYTVQHGQDEDKVVESDAECNVRMDSDEVLEEKNEGIFSVSHVESSMTYPEEKSRSLLPVEEEEPKSSWSPFDKQETVEDVAESALGKEVMQNPKFDTDPENDFKHGLDKDKIVEVNADCNVRMASDQVLEGKNEGIYSVSHVEGSMTYPEDDVISQDSHGAGPKISVSEIEAASEPTQKISSSSAQVHRPANEVQISDAETSEVISIPVDSSKSESFGNEPIHLNSLETSTINGAYSGSDWMVVSNEKEPISQGSELSAEFEDYRNPSEAHNSSALNHEAVASEIDATSGFELLDSFISDKGLSNSMLESQDVKDMAGGAIRSDVETLILAKNGDTGNSLSVDISMASPESSSEKITGKDVTGVAVTKPFNFFVRIPRYSDEKLQEQIRMAELEVNEKTKLRDSIQAQIQEKRAKNQNNGIDYEYAKGEDRSLKKLLKEKRIEIDSLQSVINKAKNATSIEDLNSRIKNIEHMIQHETLPLKEEKQLIHDIKQLKQLREQLSSSKCSYNEIQQALEQREQAEERLKTVRKELGNLKDTASKAQTACDEAESRYSVEHKKVKELQAQFRAADIVRQVAYAKFLHLSKELSQKRKNFFKFKNDNATATNSASFTDDRKAVHHHCVNEVENFMELWNGNDEFRCEYVRLNTRSALRRFGTLDGRSLGPDERPPIIPSYVREINDKVVSVPANADLISRSPAMELKPETKIEHVSSDNHSSKKETESKEKPASTKEPAKSKQVNSMATVSGMEKNEEVLEEPMKTKEELELIRIAEEVRREEAEAKLKEQRRLEEIVKAKEARERKQRRDEKAQKREELKARKEAEQKEKEREKKSRKKERKKASSASTNLQDDASSITRVEICKEEASTQVNDVSTKKPKMSRVMASKQNKTRSGPPPSLRNRNRRKWQQWIWVSLISFVVLVLFWLGNMGVFSSVYSKLQAAGF